MCTEGRTGDIRLFLLPHILLKMLVLYFFGSINRAVLNNQINLRLYIGRVS